MKKNSIKKRIAVLVLVMGLCAVLFTGSGKTVLAGMRAPGGCIMLNVLK